MERSSFPVFYAINTRWMDNDVYGHVNNVTYYSYFDSTINRCYHYCKASVGTWGVVLLLL